MKDVLSTNAKRSRNKMKSVRFINGFSFGESAAFAVKNTFLVKNNDEKTYSIEFCQNILHNCDCLFSISIRRFGK